MTCTKSHFKIRNNFTKEISSGNFNLFEKNCENFFTWVFLFYPIKYIYGYFVHFFFISGKRGTISRYNFFHVYSFHKKHFENFILPILTHPTHVSPFFTFIEQGENLKKINFIEVEIFFHHFSKISKH